MASDFLKGLIVGVETATGTAPPPPDYVQPADWIDIDNCVTGNINLLVNDSGLSSYAFLCTTMDASAYHVNWGDGTSENVASNVKAQHTYTVGAGQPCSRGYTTFKLVISPIASGIKTFGIRASSIALRSQEQGILACVVGATSLIHLDWVFYYTSVSPYVYCRSLEWFKVSEILPNCTSAVYTFARCNSLIRVDISKLTALSTASNMFNYCGALITADISSLAGLTRMGSMFNECKALRSIIIGSHSVLTTMAGAFINCYSLTDVSIGAMPLCTITDNCFYQCESLSDIDLSVFTSTTSATSMFFGCFALKNVTGIGYMTALASANSMFSQCLTLAKISLAGLTNILNTDSMFLSCPTLRVVIANGLTKVNNTYGMFSGCVCLSNVEIANLGLDAVSVAAINMFDACEQLLNIDLSSAKLTKVSAKGVVGTPNKLQTMLINPGSTFSSTSPHISVAYTSMTAVALNNLFTQLPTLVGKTIDITAAPGAATCDKTIATAKGWTVTG